MECPDLSGPFAFSDPGAPWAGAGAGAGEAGKSREGRHPGARMVRPLKSWRSVMDKAGKAAALETLKGVFAESGVVVVTHYSGLTVAEMTGLRTRLREQGGALKVIKNRIAKLALDGKGGEDAQALFQGPVAIAYSPDPVAAPKVVADFAKENGKLVLIGGLMDETVLDESGVQSLAKLPSLDQLRGKLVGLIQAPATKVAGVVQAPAGQLARVIQAYASKDAA